jgi:hypothetical protein
MKFYLCSKEKDMFDLDELLVLAVVIIAVCQVIKLFKKGG